MKRFKRWTRYVVAEDDGSSVETGAPLVFPEVTPVHSITSCIKGTYAALMSRISEAKRHWRHYFGPNYSPELPRNASPVRSEADVEGPLEERVLNSSRTLLEMLYNVKFVVRKQVTVKDKLRPDYFFSSVINRTTVPILFGEVKKKGILKWNGIKSGLFFE
jgi:hypothetical protein